MGTGLAAATAAGSCGFQEASAGRFTEKIKIAVKYQMIEEGASPLEKFQILKAAGLDGTELKSDQKVDPAEIVKASRETGMPVHGVIHGSDPDIAGAVELAEFYGGDSVLVLAREDPKLSYEENFAHWQELVRKAVPVAEKAGVKLCIENVRATFLKKAEEMARFIDSFESPAVRSYFDTGNTITWTEQPAEHWARVLGARIYKLDIKDRGHAEFGDAKLKREGVTGTDGGEVNWVGVREALGKVSFSGWATAEVSGGDRKRLAGIAGWMRGVLDGRK